MLVKQRWKAEIWDKAKRITEIFTLSEIQKEPLTMGSLLAQLANARWHRA